MKILNAKSPYFFLVVLTVVFSVGCGEQNGYSLKNATSLSVTGKVPADNDIEVDLVKPVSVVFSDDVQAATVNTSSLTVTGGGSAIPGTWTYDSSAKTATFTPTTAYPSGTTVTVNATENVLKADGSRLTPTQWSFSTVSLASLIAYWRFDGNGSDFSGNNRTAIPSNIVYDTTIVKQGTASAQFDGTASFDVGVLNLGDAFTITVWIYMPNPIANGINTVISNGAGGIPQNGFKIFINEWGTSNRTVATEAGDGNDGTLLVTSTDFVTLGAWRHLAVVIDKNAAPSQRALFYFNGGLTTQSLGAGSTLPNFPSVFGTNQQTYIGKFPGNVFYFNGHMDDFRIYNRVLTEAEILKISQQN